MKHDICGEDSYNVWQSFYALHIKSKRTIPQQVFHRHYVTACKWAPTTPVNRSNDHNDRSVIGIDPNFQRIGTELCLQLQTTCINVFHSNRASDHNFIPLNARHGNGSFYEIDCTGIKLAITKKNTQKMYKYTQKLTITQANRIYLRKTQKTPKNLNLNQPVACQNCFCVHFIVYGYSTGYVTEQFW